MFYIIFIRKNFFKIFLLFSSFLKKFQQNLFFLENIKIMVFISHKFPDSKLLIIIGAGHKEKMKKFVSKLINTNK